MSGAGMSDAAPPEDAPEAVHPVAEPAPLAEPAPAERASPPAAEADLSGLVASPQRFTGRFATVYTTLGLIGAAAIAGLVVLVIRPGYHAGPGWSTWKPKPGSAQKVASEIASHIAPRYRLGENEGQLVAVLPSPPEVTVGTEKVAIKAVAVRKAPQSNTGILIYGTTNMVDYTLCGLGAHCSIDIGTPSTNRGRLVRREALEVALYTFKFAPGVDSVTAFLTPPPGQTTGDILYLRKDDLKQQLSQPLSKTLPLDTPPLPSSADPLEAATIDKLTEPHLYTYSLTALQTGGAALILDPAT